MFIYLSIKQKQHHSFPSYAYADYSTYPTRCSYPYEDIPRNPYSNKAYHTDNKDEDENQPLDFQPKSILHLIPMVNSFTARVALY
jgi:hypothetical protein